MQTTPRNRLPPAFPPGFPKFPEHCFVMLTTRISSYLPRRFFLSCIKRFCFWIGSDCTKGFYIPLQKFFRLFDSKILKTSSVVNIKEFTILSVKQLFSQGTLLSSFFQKNIQTFWIINTIISLVVLTLGAACLSVYFKQQKLRIPIFLKLKLARSVSSAAWLYGWCLFCRIKLFFEYVIENESIFGMTVCYYHVTYQFLSESTVYSCLNVKELLDWNRSYIRSLVAPKGVKPTIT